MTQTNPASVTRREPAEIGPLHCELPDHSSIKIIGMGGVGCVALPFLAMFLRSLRRPLRLVLIDGDAFEPGNGARMHFSQLGNKAEVKAAELLGQSDVGQLAVVAIGQYVTPENVARLIREGDILFLFVDNHATRKLVSDHCQRLDNVALFSGGNEGVDPPREQGTYGNVQIALRRDGVEVTAPLTRFHPEISNPTGGLPSELDCGQLAVSTPQILFANMTVAVAALNAFFAYTCGRLAYQEVTFDILEARMLPQLPLSGGPSGRQRAAQG